VHAHVAPDRKTLRVELLDEGAPDRIRTLLVEILTVDPADDLGHEHLRVEHGRGCYGKRERAARRLILVWPRLSNPQRSSRMNTGYATRRSVW
jgi:hypothetical protein